MDSSMDAEQVLPTPGWNPTAEERVQSFAANIAMRAEGQGRKVTHPGEGADMNAALVAAVRQATLLEVHLDLGYLANDVSKTEAETAHQRDVVSARATREAYGQGVADGVAKGKEYHAREVADNERQSLHGNPAAVRELCKVVTPKGQVAAWLHIHVDPDGVEFFREVYGTLAEDVREGDNRAQIAAGPDRFMVGLDRVRFAPTLDKLVAARDLSTLEALEVIDGGTAVRAVDAMDKGGHLEARITILEEGENAEGSAPGTYVRLVSVRPGNGRVTLDLSPGEWSDLTQAVEVLYGRHMDAQAAGDES